MCIVFHREAGINNVTVGTLTCAECFTERLRLIMLLLHTNMCRAFHREAEINNVTIGTLACAKCLIEGLGLIILLLAH